MTTSPEQLAEANQGLAVFMASKYSFLLNIDFDEAVSTTMSALGRAALDHDPHKTDNFGAYAAQRMRWDMLQEAQRRRCSKRWARETLSIDDEEGWLQLECDRPSPRRVADYQVVLDALVTIKIHARRVIELRYGIGDGVERTQEEVGELLGITHQAVRLHELSGLKQLRRKLRVEGMW